MKNNISKTILGVILFGLMFFTFVSAQVYASGSANVDASADSSSDSSMSASEETDSNYGSIIGVSTAGIIDVKVDSETAKAYAIASLNLNDCSNCTVERTQVEYDGETKTVYHIESKKSARVLGFFSSDMKVSADVDAETGEVLSVHKPWWSFLAVESKTSAQANADADASYG